MTSWFILKKFHWVNFFVNLKMIINLNIYLKNIASLPFRLSLIVCSLFECKMILIDYLTTYLFNDTLSFEIYHIIYNMIASVIVLPVKMTFWISTFLYTTMVWIDFYWETLCKLYCLRWRSNLKIETGRQKETQQLAITGILRGIVTIS